MMNQRHESSKRWPGSFDEAVNKVISELSEEDKNRLKNTSFDKLIRFHFSLGMWIRNSFGLWKGNKELARSLVEKFPDRVLKLYNFEHVEPDSASMVIIEEVWKKLRE